MEVVKTNYNVVATWPRHMISLVIISNNITLSPPIVLTYHLILNSSLFWYTKSYLSIVGNQFLYIALIKSALAAIPFVRKHFLRHPTAILISTYQHLICWHMTFLDLIPLGFKSPFISLQLQVNDAIINPFSSQVGGLWRGKKTSSNHTKL